MLLGAVGAEFEVRSPSELTAVLTEWSARFARAANG
jgi:hypothetical protein